MLLLPVIMPQLVLKEAHLMLFRYLKHNMIIVGVPINRFRCFGSEL